MNNCIIEYNWIPEIYIFHNFSNNIIKPCFIYPDYFRKDNNYLVLCETFNLNDQSLLTNIRHKSNIFHLINNDKMEDDNEPLFIFTQEYYLSTYNQNIIEEHLQACLYSNLKILQVGFGYFKIGPCYGLDAGDQLYMAKHILEKIASKYNILIFYRQNILSFSTIQTRELDGIHVIYEYMKKLQLQNIICKNPIYTLKNNLGYLEILNHLNIDPYIFTSIIYKTCCLD